MTTLKDCVELTTKVEIALFDSGGEITPEIEQMISLIDLTLPRKIDHYAYRLDMFEAHEALLKKKKEQLDSLIKGFQKVQEKLKNNIKEAMLAMNKTELNGETDRFRLRRNPGRLNIFAENLIPMEFKTQLISDIVEKEKLKEALKLGPVAGAEFIIDYSLTKGKAKI